MAAAEAMVKGIAALGSEDFGVRSLQEWYQQAPV
jgi:hypothetical protein